MKSAATTQVSALGADGYFVRTRLGVRCPTSCGFPTPQTYFSTAQCGGFTLIELLVCVAILTILISLMLPSLSAARDQARLTTCAGNLHSLGQGMGVYASQYNQQLPPRPKPITSPSAWYYPTSFFQQHNWDPAVFPVIYGATYQPKIFACPANPTTEIKAQQTIIQDGINRKIPWGYQYYGLTPGLVRPPWAPRFWGDIYDGELAPPPYQTGTARFDYVTLRREEVANMPLMSDLTMRSLTNAMTVFTNHSKSEKGGAFIAVSNSLFSDGSVVSRVVSDKDPPFLHHVDKIPLWFYR